MKMKLILLSLFIAIVVFDLRAQQRNLQQANDLYELKSYAYSVPYFLKTIARNEKTKRLTQAELIDAKIKLAHAYRFIRQPQNALIWYADVIKSQREDGKEVEPVDLLYYNAQMLQSSGNYTFARKMFAEYLQKATDGNRLIDATFLTDYDKLVQQLKSEAVYGEKWQIFNSLASDYAPTFYKTDIAFASTRNRKKESHFTWSGESFSELYFVENNQVKLFDKHINSPLNEGAACFNQDFTTVFFTRNYLVNQKQVISTGKSNYLAIVTSTFNEKWREAEVLPFNNPEYNCAHPTLSADGTRLYFASDMPGGQGGMDIYYSVKQGDTWGTPVNLGKPINTMGNEIFPFVTENNRLYFTSEGRAGLGGYDIFVANLNESNSYEITNLLKPINSEFDDFGLIINPKTENGYFTSNRKGDDNIYFFNRAIKLIVTVIDSYTEQKIPNVKLKLEALTDSFRIAGNTNGQGEWLTVVNSNHDYRISGDKRGFEPQSILVSADTLINHHNQFRLNVTLALRNITLNGLVIDDSTHQFLDVADVNLLRGNTVKDEDTTYVDGKFGIVVEEQGEFFMRTRRNGYLPDEQKVSSEMVRKRIATDTTIVKLHVNEALNKMLFFKLIDARTGQPVDSAKIRFYHYYVDRVWSDSTNCLGITSFLMNPVYEYQINSDKPFYSTQTHTITSSMIDKAADGDTILLVASPPRIKGKVIDDSTKLALEDARVELYQTDHIGEIAITHPDGLFSFLTDPEFRYRYPGKYVIRANKAGYYPREFEV